MQKLILLALARHCDEGQLVTRRVTWRQLQELCECKHAWLALQLDELTEQLFIEKVGEGVYRIIPAAERELAEELSPRSDEFAESPPLELKKKRRGLRNSGAPIREKRTAPGPRVAGHCLIWI